MYSSSIGIKYNKEYSGQRPHTCVLSESHRVAGERWIYFIYSFTASVPIILCIDGGSYKTFIDFFFLKQCCRNLFKGMFHIFCVPLDDSIDHYEQSVCP